MTVRRKRIQQLAEELLGSNKVQQPPVPIERIVRAQGVKIRKDKKTDTTISGFIFRRGQDTVIGVNASNAPNRQRFTIAHELGHYLLHSPAKSDVLHVDRIFDIRFRDEVSSLGIEDDEREANLFAAELLMPRQFIAKDLADSGIDLEDDNTIQELAKKYGVSAQAMTFRLANLGYLGL